MKRNRERPGSDSAFDYSERGCGYDVTYLLLGCLLYFVLPLALLVVGVVLMQAVLR